MNELIYNNGDGTCIYYQDNGFIWRDKVGYIRENTKYREKKGYCVAERVGTVTRGQIVESVFLINYFGKIDNNNILSLLEKYNVKCSLSWNELHVVIPNCKSIDLTTNIMPEYSCYEKNFNSIVDFLREENNHLKKEILELQEKDRAGVSYLDKYSTEEEAKQSNKPYHYVPLEWFMDDDYVGDYYESDEPTLHHNHFQRRIEKIKKDLLDVDNVTIENLFQNIQEFNLN